MPYPLGTEPGDETEGVSKMIRNLKVLLLAGLAVLALGAIGASSASANFTSEHTAATAFTNVNGGNTVLTTDPDGTGATAHHVFDVAGNGPITCNKADLEGTVSGGPTIATVTLFGKGATPFTECNFLGQPATVNLNGCGFKFIPKTTIEVTCGAGKEIEFSAAGCTVKVPPQLLNEKGHVKYRNLGTGNDDMSLTAEVLATEIEAHATGVGCITTGNQTGTYTTGNTLISGHADPTGAQRPITVH